MSRIVLDQPDAPFFKTPKAEKPKRKGMRQRSRKREAHKRTQEYRDGTHHMALVAQLPCVCCVILGRKQNSPTEVHHFKSGRYSSEKDVDENTMPLCHSHHNKLTPYPGDEDITGYHNGQETWEAQFGPDYKFKKSVADQIAILDGTINF